MSERIDVGDYVNIYWEGVQPEFNIKVLYTPVATGDSWVFKRFDGKIIYANLYSKMEKVERDSVYWKASDGN